MRSNRSMASKGLRPSSAAGGLRSYSAQTACLPSPRCHCQRPRITKSVSRIRVSRVIGQDGANTRPNAESRIGMGAGSIKWRPMDVIKILIIVTLFAIVGSLGSALFHLSRGKGDSKKMARALTVRVGLSVILFILLMLAWYNGLISPHGLPVNR